MTGTSPGKVKSGPASPIIIRAMAVKATSSLPSKSGNEPEGSCLDISQVKPLSNACSNCGLTELTIAGAGGVGGAGGISDGGGGVGGAGGCGGVGMGGFPSAGAL